MYTYDSYKKDLIDYYVYEYDNTPEKKNERTKKIASYGDEYLLSIYNNSIEVCIKILEKMHQESKIYQDGIFTSIRISEDSETIFTNLAGGYHPDVLYKLTDDSPYFSLRTLKELLPKFSIYEDYDVIREEDGDIVSEYSYPKLTFIANICDFIKMYDEFNHQKKLKKMI